MEVNKTEHTSRRTAVSMIDVVTAPVSSDPVETTSTDQAAPAVPEAEAISRVTPVSQKTRQTASSTPWTVISTAVFFFVALSCLTYYAYLKSN